MRHLGGTAAAEISLCRRCVIHLLRRDNPCYSCEWQNKGEENSRAHLVNFVLNAKYKFFTKNHKSFLLIFEHRKSCLVVSSLLLFRRHFFTLEEEEVCLMMIEVPRLMAPVVLRLCWLLRQLWVGLEVAEGVVVHVTC